jgi:hypothetical protein
LPVWFGRFFLENWPSHSIHFWAGRNAVIDEHYLGFSGNDFDKLLNERSRRCCCIGFVKESGKGEPSTFDRSRQMRQVYASLNLRSYLGDFLAAYNFVNRLKLLKGRTVPVS